MKKGEKQAIAVGTGIAALAAAAAGVYMMTGKNAKNRKKVGAWAGKMQKDVIKQLQGVQKATQGTYNQVVDTVANSYQGMRNVNALELAAVAGELKNHWNTIRDEMGAAATTAKRVAPQGSLRRMMKPRTVAVKKVTTKKTTVKKSPAKARR